MSDRRPSDLQKVSVLIVDDNPHMRKLVSTLLHGLGFKDVREAIDGADAFKEMKLNPPDIVICDWVMAPLDGIDFVRLIRTAPDSPNPYVPIIMLTGHSEREKVTEARDAGVNEFLVKPISAKGLYARIYTIIEHPRPFIKSKTYFGPDRRRNNNKHYQGPERRKEENEAVDQSKVMETS